MDTSLERRIVQILCCEPNKPILEQLIRSQHHNRFQYIVSEIPILTEEGYGFIDIVGFDSVLNSLMFVECKTHKRSLPSALRQIRKYRLNCETFGVIQKKNLVGLYHNATLNNVNPECVLDIKPLIINNSVLLQQVGHSLQELLILCRNFMIEWISRNYQISPRDLQVVPKDSIPIYLIDRQVNDERKSYVGYYSLRSPLKFKQLTTSSIHAPLKLDPDATNYATFQKMNSKGSKHFSLYFHACGHSRPMLFFEVDSSFSACFIHTGQNQVVLNGYYETTKIMEKTNRIYGLIQIERGHYFVKQTVDNKLVLELHGLKSKGQISLTFLDRIYMDNDITLDSTQRSLDTFT